MPRKRIESKEKEQVLLSFLKRTREGQYAQIEESSIPYSRLAEETEVAECLYEDFYYGVS